MKSKIIIKHLILILVLFLTSKSLYAQDWLGKIVPTQTSLSQVEEMLDLAPKVIRDDNVVFKLKEGNLFIGLSLGECINTTWGKWKVEKDTIIYVIFYPKKGRKPSYYNLENKGMEEGFDSGHKTYKSDEKGLYYSTQFGKVTGINYYPSNKYKNLRCEN